SPTISSKPSVGPARMKVSAFRLAASAALIFPVISLTGSRTRVRDLRNNLCSGVTWLRERGHGGREAGPHERGCVMNNPEPWPPFRALCVDDNRDCADSFALLLRAMGFEARACYDGRAALQLNDSFRPAIGFLDLNMAGMDGDELARRLREAPG